MGYYIANQGMQQGPFELHELPHHGLSPESLVWTDGMAEWMRADSVAEVRPFLVYQPASAPTPPPPINTAAPGNFPPYRAYQTAQAVPDTNRIVAGVCGILLGSLGVHKFILGYTGAGLIMLLVSVLTCGVGAGIMHIIGLIEGIIYLTKTDEEFYQIYVVRQQQWF